ncbi:phage tail spike protein [Enterococcus sp. AZ072]|uniref:phage tail spike protein n=1 Tax=unclassified Enterococcus TaxID=2608891 RepID=UPI003D290D22
MQLIIIDRQSKQVLDVLSNEAPFATPFDDSFSGGGLTDSLETGMATYSFEVLKKYAAADNLVKGNEIAFRDKKGQDRLFQILIVEAEHDKKTIHCVDTNLVLNNNIARPYEADKEYKIADYINRFLPSKSGFSIGVNEIPHLSRKLVWEGYETITKRLRSVATQFDNAYIGFRVVMQGSQVAARFIDIYKKRGKNIGTLLQYSKQVNNIYKTEDLSELATALIGIGGMVEGSEDQEHVTFKDRHYQSADGRFASPAGDDRVYDLTMGPYWKENKPGMQTLEGFIERTFEYDTQSPQELFNRAINRLAELSQGANTYEVDVALLDDDIALGDTVRIVDHDYQPPLYLEADVLELTQHLSNKGRNTAVFGNFIEKESKIDAALRMAQEAMKQTQLQALYEWRAYADDDQGNGFTQRYVEGKKYVAIRFVKNKPIPSSNPADYAGYWTKFAGDDGENGLPGKPGSDGRTQYTHIAYANNSAGNQDFSLSDSNRKYIGMYVDFELKSSTDPTKYAWSLIKGADGSQGVPGVPGEDGRTPYLHIAYANSADGKTGFSTTDSLNKLFIGQYTDFIQQDSNDPAKYSWTKVQGPQGIPGEDGQTYYPWIVYADDVNGKNISLDGNGKPYIGAGSGTVATPSLNPKDYRFSLRYDHSLYEDVQKQIDSVPVVTVGTTRPTNPKHGDQFWQQDAEGAITGYFKYVVTGGVGAWEPQLVDQALLNIYELNAVNINGSVINGSKFTSEFTGTDDYGRPINGVLSIDGGVIKSDYLYPNEPGRTGLMRLSHEGLASVVSRDGQGTANAGFNLNTVAMRIYSDQYDVNLSKTNLSLVDSIALREATLAYDKLTLLDKAGKKYFKGGFEGISVEQRLGISLTKMTVPAGGGLASIQAWEILSAGFDNYDNPSTAWMDIKAKVNFQMNWLNNINVLNLGNGNSSVSSTGSRIYVTNDNHLVVGGNWGTYLSAFNSGSPVAVLHAAWDGIKAFKDLNMNGWKITNQSDIRLKTNITKSEIDPIKEFEQIEFYDFEWDPKHPRNEGKDKDRQYGIIAQYVPFLSQHSSIEKDNYLVIDQMKMLNLTAHAVKELIENNKSLESRIVALEEKMKKLLGTE